MFEGCQSLFMKQPPWYLSMYLGDMGCTVSSIQWLQPLHLGSPRIILCSKPLKMEGRKTNREMFMISLITYFAIRGSCIKREKHSLKFNFYWWDVDKGRNASQTFLLFYLCRFVQKYILTLMLWSL